MSSQISSVTVSGLFGRPGTVHVPLFVGSDAEGQPPLTLLYGRNGSGKSTILRLIYHALSSSVEEGHRSSIANTPFADLEIRFDDGDYVRYRRRVGGKRAGTLEGEISVKGQRFTSNDTFVLGKKIFVEDVDESPGSLSSGLEHLDVFPVILTDSRQIFSDLIEDEEYGDRENRFVTRPDGRDHRDELLSEWRNNDVFRAIDEVEQFLAATVYRATQNSQGQVDQTYTEVVRSIVAESPQRGRPNERRIPDLIARVNELAEQLEPYRRYGLVTPVPRDVLADSLLNAQKGHGVWLERVLTPYLDSLAQRVKSMAPVYETLDSYIRSVNRFLEGKSINFSVAENVLRIVSDDTGEEIRPDQLSSGEKHLVMLLSYVTAMQERTRVLVIDEPEISLNPDWQRKIIPALLEIVAGTDIQLICATHSVSILAPYDDHVVELQRLPIEH